MTWDDEVDVVCIGGVVGTLASAVVAADAEVEVYVATTVASDGGWLGTGVTDPETLEYFAALTAGPGPVEPTTDDGVPMRVVHDAPADERRGRKVAPFFGGRLDAWAADCLSSPYGLLHTRVTDWDTTAMRTLDDKPVQVKIVGTMALDGPDGASSLAGWLFDAADARGIDIHTDTALQRLVLEEGIVTGAVLDTADGPWAIRARHGVTLAPAVTVGEAAVAAGGSQVQVALVSQTGSRFARVEALVPAAAPSTGGAHCSTSSGRLSETLRDRRSGRSPSRRRREVDRHPPFGQ
ncbi:FAD-binding protein [Mycobacterium sp. WMMD1722]|uniref:FAD-binding protein n=1 Tax=Mycobacterium sp. WMMD1722 TaxID=3404117 RepID=UPI003BF5769F